MRDKYTTVPDRDTIANTHEALSRRGFTVTVVDDLAAAKKHVLSMIPHGAQVLTAASVTLDQSGIAEAIDYSGDYDAIRPKFYTMRADPAQRAQMRRLGAAPDYIIGSVQAVTTDGQVLIVSATGSQLAGYLHGAEHVIWVVGAQKIVADLDQARDRVTAYVQPHVDERTKADYGVPSEVNKEVVVSRELTPGRIDIVLVAEPTGL